MNQVSEKLDGFRKIGRALKPTKIKEFILRPNGTWAMTYTPQNDDPRQWVSMVGYLDELPPND